MIQTSKFAFVTEKDTEAKPFLKWAGGKSQLLSQFYEFYPEELKDGRITRYIEPFLGGGAHFLAIAQRFDNIKEAFLTDINPELILVYRVVKRDVFNLITLLEEHQRKYDGSTEKERIDYFYCIRDLYNEQRIKLNYTRYSKAWVTRAARMIFLNKTCFNGLFRVNTKGEFNVPFGHYKVAAICDPENLKRVSNLLQNAQLQVASFKLCKKWVTEDTFVYFDPPYRPISPTSSFTSYSKDGFDEAKQIELAKFFAHLHKKFGAKLMLSNSDPSSLNPDDDFFKRHYKGFEFHSVLASRMINSQADKRGKITELLITNY